MADYLPNARLYGSAYLPDVDRRRTPRKKLVRRVTLAMPGGETLRGMTVDISQGGLSVLVDKAVPLDQSCTVRFDMYFNGRSISVTGAGKVRNCSLSGLDGFRLGMVFAISHPAAQEFINDYLGPDGVIGAPGNPSRERRSTGYSSGAMMLPLARNGGASQCVTPPCPRAPSLLGDFCYRAVLSGAPATLGELR